MTRDPETLQISEDDVSLRSVLDGDNRLAIWDEGRVAVLTFLLAPLHLIGPMHRDLEGNLRPFHGLDRWQVWVAILGLACWGFAFGFVIVFTALSV